MMRTSSMSRWGVAWAMLGAFSLGCDDTSDTGADAVSKSLQAELSTLQEQDPALCAQVETVRPILKCVERTGDSGYLAHFGYSNDASQAVLIPVGDHNRFFPFPQDRGQPTTFAPGFHEDVVQVPFTKLSAWVLGDEFEIATRYSKPCSATGGTGGSGTGGVSGTGGKGTGGANTGGANTGGANTGGANTGGANTGGAATGGRGTGGANTGGANTGGAATGGRGTGGANTGGANTGGAATGGRGTGGANTGGANTGGAATGGRGTGGANTGGANTGGAATGGRGTGGANTGGANTGGANTGGANTGGANTGGAATGGRGTGGANTGGANTGGANTGGANTGGANTGGANTGGANTGGANTGGASTGGAGGGQAGFVCTQPGEPSTTPASQCVGPACTQCTIDNCVPDTDGCSTIADPNDRALCDAAYQCFVANSCTIQGDATNCWCGTNLTTCITDNAPPTQANGPCLQQIFAAAKTTDAGTIRIRFNDASFPLGRASNLAACRGGFCPAECSVP